MNKSYEQNISESNYSRPESTYTDILNQAIDNHGFNAPCIKAKLENYEKVENIENIPIGKHIRYFIWCNNENKLKFRTGGFIKLIFPEYLILTNNKNSWTVQRNIKCVKNNHSYETLFFKLLSSSQLKDKELLKKKNQINILKKKLEEYESNESSY